jgi:hypothetical protein
MGKNFTEVAKKLAEKINKKNERFSKININLSLVKLIV